MKIFISMGMKSKSTEQVRVEMNKAFKQIKEKLPEAELIDSIIDGADKNIALKGDDIAMWYLAKSIELMSDADMVFFIGNYKEFRGCSIEWEVAKKYSKVCVEFPLLKE